jgi:hypothetical protein
MLGVITALSLILAAAMGIVAWRLAREDRRRSQARVAVLASDLADLDLRSTAEVAATGAELFRSEEQGHGGSRFAAVLTIGAFAVATALALIVVTSRFGQSVAEPVQAQPRLPGTELTRSPGESVPLELLSLTHEREGDGIIVRGVVRNPAAGADQERVAAVVVVFTRGGAFLASGQSPLAGPVLAPGSETAFVVTVPHASEVGRYRVSFRSDDRVVPHVDRRERTPIARLQ